MQPLGEGLQYMNRAAELDYKSVRSRNFTVQQIEPWVCSIRDYFTLKSFFTKTNSKFKGGGALEAQSLCQIFIAHVLHLC